MRDEAQAGNRVLADYLEYSKARTSPTAAERTQDSTPTCEPVRPNKVYIRFGA